MENLKVVKIDQESIEFDNGAILTSDHQSDCCERGGNFLGILFALAFGEDQLAAGK